MSKQHRNRSSDSGRTLIGLIIILIGGLLLLDNLIPAIYIGWLFQWPMILIIIGAIIGAKSGFENRASYILIGIGVFFLLSSSLNFSIGPFIWPLILIFVGFFLIKGRSKKRNRTYTPPGYPGKDDFSWDKRVKEEEEPTEPANSADPSNPETENTSEGTSGKQEFTGEEYKGEFHENADDYIESTTIFGNGKHYVVSQNFKGGEIVNIMGGATINLMRADLKGYATLEVVQLFGGTTIIAPSHWVIQPEMASIFGGIEDKRFHTPTIPDRSKVLYIKGTSMFGGITVKTI